MVQIVPPVKGGYCRIRSIVIDEECYVPFESGWVYQPRGLRTGEVIEPDVMMEIYSFVMDNSSNLPLCDGLGTIIWATTWLMYVTVALGIMYVLTDRR